MKITPGEVAAVWFVLVEFYEVGDSEGGKFALKIEKVMGFIHLLHQILKIHRPWANSTQGLKW